MVPIWSLVSSASQRPRFQLLLSGIVMLVHFVTDEPTKIPAVRQVLEPRYQVVPWLLGSDDKQKGTSGVLMVDADLRKSARVEQVRLVLQELSGDIAARLFIVKNDVRSLIAQAYALGATAVVSRPREILFELEQIEATGKGTHSEDAATAPPEVTDSAMAFASMFSAARRGRQINFLDAEQATAQIITSIEQNGLRAWLDDVRRYHEGTFQHCLLVTGVAVSFALELGFAGSDVARLGIAATLHDIGKAHIPLTILDKPGRLDPREEERMRLHPVIGYDLLKDVPGISVESLEGVRHHHEYLDGSGYPDGLKAPAISDLVRLLTISDIFAALIEARPYRPPMSRQDAYKILRSMDGKLETSLVKAFRDVALVA
jgi:putative nucleotidyltransferase with HDIG domain